MIILLVVVAVAVRCLLILSSSFAPRRGEQRDRLYAMKSIHVNRLSKSRVQEFENEVR